MTNKDPNLIKRPISTDEKNGDSVDSQTIVHKGTKTLNNEVYDSKHVKEGDNPARQPDRRDQQGQTAFDDGVNEQTSDVDTSPQSQQISEHERYASIDNAQTRVLPEDDSKLAK